MNMHLLSCDHKAPPVQLRQKKPNTDLLFGKLVVCGSRNTGYIHCTGIVLALSQGPALEKGESLVSNACACTLTIATLAEIGPIKF